MLSLGVDLTTSARLEKLSTWCRRRELDSPDGIYLLESRDGREGGLASSAQGEPLNLRRVRPSSEGAGAEVLTMWLHRVGGREQPADSAAVPGAAARVRVWHGQPRRVWQGRAGE